MGRRVFSFLILLGILFMAHSLWAAKVLIVTDQASQEKAKEIKKLLESTKPFSLLQDFTISIRSLPKDAVQCKQFFLESAEDSQYYQAESCKKKSEADTENAQRGINCDVSEALTKMSGKENADRVIFVKESDINGGSSKDTITMTTAAETLTVVHELLHSFGFEDEYEYPSECEADTYCHFMIDKKFPNLAVFKEENPYASDTTARKKHAAQIAWFSQIKPLTKITTGTNLGTPQENEIGLHPVKVCDKAATKVKSWRPGNKVTVMETLETSYIPEMYWDQIAQGLHTEIATPPKKNIFPRKKNRIIR